MKLQVTTPLAVVVEEDGVLTLKAEDASGSFGIQPGHAEFLTCLEIGVVTWQGVSGPRHFCAVHGGVLSVNASRDIAIATREAVLSEDLATLETAVLAKFRADAEIERKERVDSTRLHLEVIRRIVGRLRGSGPTGGERRA